MLEGLDDVPWAEYAQPAGNTGLTVPSALRALADAFAGTDASAPDRWGPCHRFLYALGNNHAGTYFPVILPALPFLGELLRGPPVARGRALDVLIDLIGSFIPEPGHETVATADGPRPLAALVHDAVTPFTGDLERLLGTPASEEEGRLAREVLELLQDGEGGPVGCAHPTPQSPLGEPPNRR